MHFSRMHTVRNSSRLLLGGRRSPHPPSRHPRIRHPPSSPPPPAADPQEQAPPTARHAVIPPAVYAGIAPPQDRMTDTCKNITFATSLRTVTIRQLSSATLISTETLITSRLWNRLLSFPVINTRQL